MSGDQGRGQHSAGHLGCDGRTGHHGDGIDHALGLQHLIDGLRDEALTRSEPLGEVEQDMART